ncbi:MAG: UPF0182 family protein [Methanosarcinales archaeon]|nr:UPF0182 family protein [Methanosarcinales archaeon]
MAQVRNRTATIIILLAVTLLLSISRIANLVTDYWWFEALGFSRIFIISLKAKFLLFLLSTSVFFAFVMINLWISSKANESKVPFSWKFAISLALAFLVGLASYQKWFILLQYLNQVPFNLQDPIFSRDVAFYIFSLPLFLAIKNFLLFCVAAAIVLVVLDYMQSFLGRLLKQPQVIAPDGTSYGINVKSALSNLKGRARVHIAILGSLFFAILAVGHYLTGFSIMYSDKGIVVGAGYTDVMIFLPILRILMILAAAIAVLCCIWMFVTKKTKNLEKNNILLSIIIIYLLSVLILPTVIPAMVQTYKVSPSEMNLEKPYIEDNIRFTRIAYGLSDVEEKTFPVEMNLTPEIIASSSETMDNVRILDWRPLTQTYRQTQEMRLYYDLSGIDIDRYEINGKYTEVMIAPREMNQAQISENAKTWVNLHLVYTHGFGVVMSPVNSVTREGMPNYLIKDIPPVYTVPDENLRVDVPQLYYGEEDNDFVLVNTRTPEFDYPKGDTNAYINYDGRGGVQLDSFAKKLAMAVRFSDIKILLSSDVTPESRIMFDRSIRERIKTITPFLLLDRGPYLIIDEGRLFWIQDAYTVSDRFPYGEKVGSINYMRNSVKIVVDAYNGSVTYYITDTTDPVISTYTRMFPEQFKSFDMMPHGIKEHIRYPEDLFKVQSAIYSTYHMNDATVFYNKEDAWQIPNEVYGTGQQIQVEPYYIIMKLPGEERGEFVLMSSFTPIKKDNMVAWLAARSDGENYGKLLLYKFPKEKLVYGPLQIEAKFDQDSTISEQLTLWSQQGSRVTRGNLLVIPLADSILYIEPLYIQAETGQLPELKRVLVSDGKRVVMEANLNGALLALFGETGVRQRQMRAETEREGEKSTDELISEAQEYYNAILDSMGKNWTAFGENFDRLGEVLRELG